MKQIVLRFDEAVDADLLAALDRLPKGDRAGRIRDILRQALVEAPNLAASVTRLAAALERLPVGTAGTVPVQAPVAPAQTTLAERMRDPVEKERIKAGVLGGF